MKKYKKYVILVFLTMGSQALFYFLIKSFLNDFNVIDSFIKIPLIKEFIYFYSSWYPFIILNTFLIYKKDDKIFNYVIISMLIGTFLSHITFIIYPSIIVRPTIVVNNFTDWLLDFTYRTDSPAVNCLPSMHAVYCFITSFHILKCKNLKLKFKILIVTYSMLIVASTVFIKQHVVEDLILAFIYSMIAIVFVHLNKERINQLFNKIAKKINF